MWIYAFSIHLFLLSVNYLKEMLFPNSAILYTFIWNFYFLLSLSHQHLHVIFVVIIIKIVI